MATVVLDEITVNASNQKDAGQGGHVLIVKSKCPDLWALTSQHPSYTDPDERILPVGWKVKIMVDSSTGAIVDERMCSPDGRCWSKNTCKPALETGDSKWTWASVGFIALALYWIFSKK